MTQTLCGVLPSTTKSVTVKGFVLEVKPPHNACVTYISILNYYTYDPLNGVSSRILESLRHVKILSANPNPNR